MTRRTLLGRPRRIVAAIAAGLLLPLGGMMVSPPMSAAATAGTYHHIGLGYAGYGNSDGFTTTYNHGGLGYVGTGLAPTSAYGQFGMGARDTFNPGEATLFRYDAPANTTITNVYWVQHVSGLTVNEGTYDWNLLTSSPAAPVTGNLYSEVPPANTTRTLSLPTTATSVSFMLQCGGPHACKAAGGNGAFSIDSTDFLLSDAYSPTVGAASNTLTEGGTGSKITGTKDVSFNASDAGSGLYYAYIYDGAKLAASRPFSTNGGHCVDLSGNRMFDRAVPCVLSSAANVTLNTTTLTDGLHSLRVVVADAAGNTSQVWSGSRLVANHPPVVATAPSFDAPAVAAKPVPGTELVAGPGTWTGPSLSYVYAWQRCDAQGSNCAQIPGALTLKYVPTSDDVGHRLRLAITATNVADSVTAYTDPTGVVTQPSSAGDTTIKNPPTDGNNSNNGTNGNNGAAGSDGSNGTNGPAASSNVQIPALPSPSISTTVAHLFVGRVAGEPAGVGCPGDKATIKFEHVKGSQMKVANGKATTVQAALTCTNSGKAITGARLEIATKIGTHPVVAADMTTDGAGHAVLRIAKGASRGVTVGYRMYADDPIARAVTALKVLVNSRVMLTANHKKVRNGQAVTLRGSLAGGEVPKRGVTLSVQWRDGKKWRPFAQVKTNNKGAFKYAYKFLRTRKATLYQLRVQITKGQLDYPYEPTHSKAVKVIVTR